MDRANSDLVHLSKNRVKPTGRRPPSKAGDLAHLITNEPISTVHWQDEDSSPSTEDIAVKRQPSHGQTPPKPRPKSMQ